MLKKLIFTACLLLIQSCEKPTPTYFKITGVTMGTSYQVTLENTSIQQNEVKQQIDKRLEAINQLMSTYIVDSELSQFNQSNRLDCQPISAETLFVIKNALDVSKLSKGKFDVTVAPLIEEWGFDKKNTHQQIPSQQTINSLLTQIGSNKIILEDNCITKKMANVSINLSAIAKGYAVDEIAKLIQSYGVKNYLVEIGGEIANQGLNNKGLPWRLAIESATTQNRSIQKVLLPKGLGVATSGDYRNYFEKNGKRFSHTIDPTTGYPITHQLASITVLHTSTMIADALATALDVMGPNEAMIFAETNNIPIFMLVKNGDEFKEVYNRAFSAYIE